MFSVGRIIRLIILGLLVAGLIYTGVWHYVTLFIWQNPMLTWLPLLAFFGVGFLVGAAFAAIRGGGRSCRPRPPRRSRPPRSHRPRRPASRGWRPANGDGAKRVAAARVPTMRGR